MAPITPAALSAALKAEAYRLGFDLCHITPAATAPHAPFFARWAAAGRPGEMAYLVRNREKRARPALLAEPDTPPIQSIVVLGVNYHQADLPPTVRDDPSRGLIASYAWGDDYHELIRPLLHELDAYLAAQSGRATRAKCLVDTGPVLERDWAMQAGLGFTGKNCCTITPGLGSWLFLAVILAPEALAPDPPPALLSGAPPPPQAVWAGLPPTERMPTWELAVGDRPRRATCASCARCLDACPTAAFVGPYHLDPQRCISYWTIEARGPIPRELRPLFGNRIFGCDICQEVCPWNARLAERTPRIPGLAAQAGRMAPPLLEGFAPATPYWLDEAAFRARFRRSPLLRARRRGMLRNVCVALGNWGDPAALPALASALADPEPLARGHAAWALGRLAARRVPGEPRRLLAAALPAEQDPWVRDEIEAALAAGNLSPDAA